MDTLAEIEAIAWAAYLDTKGPRLFEEWKRLWKLRNVEVPKGAWECP